MNDVSHSVASTIQHPATRHPTNGPIVGIWRVGEERHQSKWASLSLAQPADAAGSPRWDYTLKRATDTTIESVRQINQFVAAAACVKHPNLVAVLDSSGDASPPYLVMPKLEGESMAQHLRAHAPKKLPVALWLVRQTAQALVALHAEGWIHGDVKPENVMIGSRGHATLIDLGFATRIHSVRANLFRGTPDYASPESLSDQHAAIAAMDIFSLGRILWQWMTHIESVSQVVLEPIADLVESMIADDSSLRPTANEVVKQLLQLEIETLGRHIGPSPVQADQHRRAA